ncbi:ATP-dependent endonuclease [Demequina sp. NBRC 110052]|uniref:ATP-dependent nuclease n=1 Tax=Demequina sp. NBRC 110052 TaxID=1570341 RepID=UPI0013566BF9|nr:AAA family ATPase [Demequina sp. NBRC 110052]
MIDEEPLGRMATLSVSGFRGFRESQSLRLAQPSGAPGSGLTVIVGANNTGKSTIWESFDAIARKTRQDVSFSEGRRNRLSPNGVSIEATWAGGFTFALKSRSPNTSETRSMWTPSEPTRDRAEIVSVPSRRYFQSRFGKNTTTERDWMNSSSDFARSRRFDHNDQFTGRLFDLHNNEEKKARFDKLMTEVVGKKLEWTIDLSDGPDGQSFYVRVATGEGLAHTSEGLGDGIISLLFILNALYDSEPRTLLVIDEPELSLHPQMVRRLGKVMARYAADRQIVLFTHSPLLVRWDDIERGAEVARVYKAQGDSRVAQASRACISDLSGMRASWRNPHALGNDANEILFLDDGVVVVEGQEDAALLPRAFEDLGVEMCGTIFGWGAGGEGNIAKLLALLNDLGYERVAAVLDNNVPDTVARIQDQFPNYMAQTIPAPDIRDKPERGVEGLMDERGRAVKDVHRAEAAATLSEVSRYLTP